MSILTDNTNIVSIVNFFALIVWISLMVIAFLKLRKKNLGGIATFLWVLLILYIPIVGAAVFLLVSPKERQREATGLHLD